MTAKFNEFSSGFNGMMTNLFNKARCVSILLYLPNFAPCTCIVKSVYTNMAGSDYKFIVLGHYMAAMAGSGQTKSKTEDFFMMERSQ